MNSSTQITPNPKGKLKSEYVSKFYPRYITRGGKPKMPMAKKRIKSVCLRLSIEEHQLLSEKAKAAGLSVSSLLRDHVGRVGVYNHKGQQHWVAILLSLRKHLTALTEKVAGFGPLDAAVAIAYLSAIARHLDRLAKQERKYARQIFSSRDRQQ